MASSSIPNFNAVNLSPHPAYDQKQPDGSSKVLEGVQLGEGTYGYCLENDLDKTMMGDMNDSTVLSKEACEARIDEGKAGNLPALEMWGLDAPESPNTKMDARKSGSPAIDALTPRSEASDTSKKAAPAPSSETKASAKTKAPASK
jgi:hypothetical protein